MIVVPINPTPLPTPPSTSDPVNFDPRADAFLGGLPNFQTQTNALAEATYQNALESQTQAGIATTQASNASASASAAQAVSNYKGEWSTLSGALNPPATVSHQGRLWYLKQALANVASQAPALGSAYWGEVGKNQFITYVAPAGNTNAVDQGLYVMTAASSVLVLPANPPDGMIVAAVNTSGTITPYINRNGKSILGDAENFTMNVLNFQIVLQYFAAQNNWVQVMGVTAYTSAQPVVNSANTFSAVQNFTGGINLNGNAIFARGSNTNGEYIRFADGTQIAWGKRVLSNRSWAVGEVYSPSALSFPVPFISPPVLNVSNESGNPAQFYAAAEGVRSNQIDLIHIKYSGSSATTMQNTYCYLATGRWF